MLEDVKRARHMLTELSDLLRYSLSQPKGSLTSIKEEIDVVKAYVALAQIQYEDRLQYHEDIDEALLCFEVPPMMIQMLVENAIKHGFEYHVGTGLLYLGIMEQAEVLSITVRNPGSIKAENLKLMDQATTGLGIANIKQRLQLLFADQASIKIKEFKGEVEVKISMPAQQSAELCQ